MQKSLKAKYKEMITKNHGKMYDDIIDFEDTNFLPAPLKISYQTINSMNEFRVRILHELNVYFIRTLKLIARRRCVYVFTYKVTVTLILETHSDYWDYV